MCNYIYRRYLCGLGIIGAITGFLIAVCEANNLPTSLPNQHSLTVSQLQNEANSNTAEKLQKYIYSTHEFKIVIAGVVTMCVSFICVVVTMCLGLSESKKPRPTDKHGRRITPALEPSEKDLSQVKRVTFQNRPLSQENFSIRR